MSALTSLLVRDQKVPVRKIEEAIQRQVIAGGGLDTILLEAGVLPENELASYCAAVYRLGAATRAECMDVPRDVIRTVPSEVAERHRLVPLSFDGNRLIVVVAEPLSFEVEQQLGFLLGVTVEQRIAPEGRVAAALDQHYGVELVPRMRRLNNKLNEQSAGTIIFVEPLALTSDADRAAREPEGTGTMRFGTVSESQRPSPPRAERDSVSVARTVSLNDKSPAFAATSASTAAGPSSAPPQEVVDRLKQLSAPPGAPRVSVPRSKSLVRHRGPLTAHRAVELLKASEERDEILEVSFAFLRQFFDVTAVFVCQEGEAEGLDIAGSGVDLSRFERLGVPLDEPSAFRTAAEGPVPVVTKLNTTEQDIRVARELARVDQTPALILPIAIRNRVVLMFYGDRSGEAFDLSDVPEPVAFAPRVSEALQQLILRRKFRGSTPQGPTGSRAPSSISSASVPASEPAAELSSEPEVRTTKEYASPPSDAPPTPAYSQLAEDESHVRWSDPPREAPARRKRGRARSPSMEILGVPRSAPPPPMPGQQPNVTLSSRPPKALADRSAETDDGEDFPELTVDETDAPDEAPRVGSYVMKGGTTEVVRRSQHPARGQADEAPTPLEPPKPAWRKSDDLPAPREERADRSSAAPLPLTSTIRRPTPAGVEIPIDIVDTLRRPTPAHQDAPVDVVAVRDTPADSRDRGRARAKRDTQPDTPSVIIEMGANIEAAVEDLRYSGPDEPEAAIQAVLQHGEAALPVLVREFPGPLFFDRSQPHRRLPRGRDISAVGRAIVAFGDLAVPYVVSLLNRADPATRFYAVLLSSEFSHSRLVQPLGERIFDEDDGVGTLALDVLRTLRPFERELRGLCDKLRSEARTPRASLEHRALALRAIGELRDSGALDLLLVFAEKEPHLGEAALRSLRQLTRQDFGEHLDRWKDWIDQNYKRHRIEWLIDALVHNDEPIRREASEELKELTHEYFGYHPALSKKEREIAQRKYRRWWDEEGKLRFASTN